MFGFLKKAVGTFINKVTGKEEDKEKKPEGQQEEQKPEEEKPTAIEQATPEETIEQVKEVPEPARPVEAKPTKPEDVEDEIVRQAELEVLREKETQPKPIQPQPEVQKPVPVAKPTVQQPAPQPKAIEQPKAERKTEAERKIAEPKPTVEYTQPEPAVEERKPAFQVKEEKRELAPKVGLFKKLTGLFTGSVTIGEKEVEPLFDDLRIALLESDVSLDTTEFLVEDLHKRLVGKQVARGGVDDAVKGEVRNALMDLFGPEKDILFETVGKQKPIKILFIGPNGAGKTTTIAKIAFLLKEKGFTSVIAASDTFRAAAIEQASLHGEKLGIRVIKHKYGADPAAVAFDAIAHAKAEKLDFVLIDTAGRQETNYNLVKEMEKINRVIEPDYKVFVGESVAGHSLIEQAKKFNETVGLDGLVLTKLDADAKGGTAFSIAHDLKIPILFIGVGQEYSDLKPFKKEWLVDNVLS